MNARQSSVVILGGGPGGYEAALVAAHLGARVTVVDRDGLGGAAVLTDCVPSKTLISTADFMSQFGTASDLGVHLEDHEGDEVTDSVAELAAVNRRVLALAAAQSHDIGRRLDADGVTVLSGTGRLLSPGEVEAQLADGSTQRLTADVVLVATGATPRVMPSAQPDPSTSATSCVGEPVRSAMTAAAARATSNGSVAGSDRSGEPVVGRLCSVTPELYPPGLRPGRAPDEVVG